MNFEINKDDGYIKLYRSIWNNPIVSKDADHIAIWVYLLTHAAHKKVRVSFGGKQIDLKPGELTTGRKFLSREMQISESKVQRVFKSFEIEQQIEQRTDRQCRLISILNWDEYQQNEQRNEQRVNNDRTTSEQRVNTKQECKNEKNERRERGQAPVARSVLQNYVQEKNLNVDVDVFWSYYEENDWVKKNGSPVTDWKKTLATWAAREQKQVKKKPKPKPEPPRKEKKPEKIDAVPMPEEIRKKFNRAFKSV